LFILQKRERGCFSLVIDGQILHRDGLDYVGFLLTTNLTLGSSSLESVTLMCIWRRMRSACLTFSAALMDGPDFLLGVDAAGCSLLGVTAPSLSGSRLGAGDKLVLAVSLSVEIGALSLLGLLLLGALRRPLWPMLIVTLRPALLVSGSTISLDDFTSSFLEFFCRRVG
ncbi:hypothetical protein PFISCL1PPCAC_19050, partial [Pristionchus fissidentatus]